jgi:hydrogenase maturation protease
VVGLGSADRGDDAVGAAVVRAVAALLPTADVHVHEDPSALLDLWWGRDLVVVVDAVRSGAPGGTVHVLEAGRTTPVPGLAARVGAGIGGTHAFGLAEVVDLARALRRLPDRLVVVGVEVERLDHGAPLSPAVAAAVPVAAVRVADLVVGTREEAADVPR